MPKEDADYREGLEIADILCNPLSRARRGLIEANPKCMQYGEKTKYSNLSETKYILQRV